MTCKLLCIMLTGNVTRAAFCCRPCEKNQYVINPMKHACKQCPAGARCPEGTFTPHDPADSVWNATQMGVNRLVRCPAGYVLVRDEENPTLDRCLPCPPYTYSVEEAFFGQRPLWTGVCVRVCMCVCVSGGSGGNIYMHIYIHTNTPTHISYNRNRRDISVQSVSTREGNVHGRGRRRSAARVLVTSQRLQKIHETGRGGRQQDC